ncbi:hypothetical protein [Butyrivibrio sp. VCB2006]|uniref:hypothetical protein n=1 Tax=Butyrivibrio sp. VCB2006 TaxID=1280679 RepID=UPI00041B5A78|nr:hypothetical protein [Butyrivibrio sp. VCB2006]
MAKVISWEFNTADGTPVEINLRRNTWVSVNGGEEVNARTIKNKAESNIFENVLDIALPNNEIAKLFVSTTKKHMVYNGRDVNTGEEYAAAPIPGWAWIFVVLYAFNFLAVLGGALGGMVNLFAAALSIQIATRCKKSTGVKVLLSALLFVAVAAISLVIATIILGVRGQ